MVKTICILLLTCLAALGQAFTLQDTAFLGNAIPKVSGGTWAPTNAYGWWHADSMTASDGDLVTHVADSVGAHDFWVIGATNTYSPFFTNNAIGGKPCLYWPVAAQANPEGLTNDFGSTLSGSMTWIFVCEHVNPANYEYSFLADGIDGTYRRIAFVDWGDGVPYPLAIVGGSTLNGSSRIDLAGWMVLTICFNGASSYVRTNGVLYVSGDTGSSSTKGITLGQYYSPTLNRSWSGGIAELIMYNATLATNDLQWVESSLKTKYGL